MESKNDLKIEGTATIGTKGQIVIPKNVRNKFNLGVGDDLVVLSGTFGVMLIKSDNLHQMVDRFENLINSIQKI